MKIKSLLITALCLSGFTLASQAYAATFSVRLGQPKSPTNQNNIKLTYVALDSDNREITVRCYKKGPSDGDFVAFDTPKTMIPGGNTDHCLVDSNILNTKGTYSFKITGEIGAEVIPSSIVSLDYNTDGPGTPSDFSKDRINSCDYKIKFKTADDGGKTIKVQLFRSDNLSVSVDPGSVIASQMISSNTNGEIINSVPDCSKNYYYVLRAVDNSDNVSGIVGDSFTTTTSSTTTTSNSGSTGSNTGNSQDQAIVVNGGSQVTSVTDGSASSSADKATEVTISPEPTSSVLGTSTSKTNYLKWIIAGLLLVGGYLVITKKPKVS